MSLFIAHNHANKEAESSFNYTIFSLGERLRLVIVAGQPAGLNNEANVEVIKLHLLE